MVNHFPHFIVNSWPIICRRYKRTHEKMKKEKRKRSILLDRIRYRVVEGEEREEMKGIKSKENKGKEIKVMDGKGKKVKK